MSDLTDEIQVLHIPLENIDLTDTQYQISREDGDITGLALSIKETGLTSLPIVRPLGESGKSGGSNEPGEPDKSSESYILVTGFKRIKALTLNGYRGNVVCLTYIGALEEDWAVRAVSDTAFQRPLTPAELIKSILFLSGFMEATSMAKRSLSIFNTQLNPKYIKDLQQIATLPQKAIALMDDGRLSIKSAKKISRFSPELANCFVTLFSSIKASASKQMEIIANFLEIAAREKIKPIDLYREQDIREILALDNKDIGQKGNLLRAYLIERRFPFLEKKRRDIQKKINSLKLGPGIKFTAPDNFESMTYSCSIEFKTPAEYAARMVCLNRVSTHPDFEEILKR